MSISSNQIRSADSKRLLTPNECQGTVAKQQLGAETGRTTLQGPSKKSSGIMAQNEVTTVVTVKRPVFRIFDLPAELRSNIYEQFVDDRSIVKLYPARAPHQQDFALPTVPQGLLAAMPEWARSAGTMVVEVNLKAPRFSTPFLPVRRTKEIDQVHVKFELNNKKVYRMIAHAGDPMEVFAQDALLAWMAEKVEEVKQLMVGYLQEDQELEMRLREDEKSPILTMTKPTMYFLHMT
ncbi:unnamed protein product [Zymoseptoria tritici ST99CH_1E4]|uniref:Uncharacterized protein n=1 Tax=Zymoseptoria tritici ST99CH_1E4 TaxID=1276532 RepID=A0A2H1GPY3_ZYMTR|nr:unnamed protein product [Zymoseptoria tritici ST99CH_1E4]